MIVATLPIPPSANALFANRKKGRGRIITQDYAAWRTEAGFALNRAETKKPISGFYTLEIRVTAKMRGDIDNRIKAISDLLVSHGLVVSDTRAWRITISRDADILKDTCRIVVLPKMESFE